MTMCILLCYPFADSPGPYKEYYVNFITLFDSVYTYIYDCYGHILILCLNLEYQLSETNVRPEFLTIGKYS